MATYLETLEKIETLKADIFVPSHTDPCKDVRELAEINRQKVFEVERIIKTICNTPKTTDDIISEIFRTFGLIMTIEQYVLVGSTVRSYLSWMKDRGVLDFIINNSALLWLDAELS